MLLTITVLVSLLTVALYAVVMSEGTFKLSQIGSINSRVAISGETPNAVLAEQLRMGNIDREVYEMLVSEKLGVKLA
jgi:hypothetical protein